MASLHEWLNTYGTFHQNPKNIFIHEICVPLIMFSVLGLLWIIPIPAHIRQSIEFYHIGIVNVAVLVFLLALIYYIRLSIVMAIGMGIASIIMLSILAVLQYHHHSILIISLIIFVISWIGQFIGHKIEGRKPAFLTDMQFLLIGPAWILSRLYKIIGITY
jgi:uncharacterized membrane protein YGL010W